MIAIALGIIMIGYAVDSFIKFNKEENARIDEEFPDI